MSITSAYRIFRINTYIPIHNTFTYTYTNSVKSSLIKLVCASTFIYKYTHSNNVTYVHNMYICSIISIDRYLRKLQFAHFKISTTIA